MAKDCIKIENGVHTLKVTECLHLRREFPGTMVNTWLDCGGLVAKEPPASDLTVARRIIEDWMNAPNGYRGMELIEEERESLAAAIARAIHAGVTPEKRILDDVLILLAGEGYPTPEKGFTGWEDALSSFKRFVRATRSAPEQCIEMIACGVDDDDPSQTEVHAKECPAYGQGTKETPEKVVLDRLRELLETNSIELQMFWNQHFPERELEKLANHWGFSFD